MKPKQHAQKNLVKGDIRTHFILLGRPQTILINLYAQLILVISVAVKGSQLIKSDKICHFIGL